MKQAVSISLGSTVRDKTAKLNWLGQDVSIAREGTNGDVQQAAARFRALDGQVDALGVGGIDLWLQVEQTKYPLYTAHKLVRDVKQTPVVDGGGLKNTLEQQVVSTLIEQLGSSFQTGRVLLTAGVDRFGMTHAFFQQGYEVVCADLMFALGLPIPIRTLHQLRLMARLLMPIVGRLPIHIIYPTGNKQNEIQPKFKKWYQWADVIAGDCLYIKRHMPDDLSGKVIVTNTTTSEDLALFRQRGVRHVMTTTPQINGRSFGTNLMEAALTAVSGKNRPLTYAELKQMLQILNLKPTLHTL